jgi:hypothetical protein
MNWFCWGSVALISALPSAAADLVHFKREGNIFSIQATEGGAELEWITSSTFRYARHWGFPTRKPQASENLELTFTETATELRFTTEYLRVALSKLGLALKVEDAEGKSLAHLPEGRVEQIFSSRKTAFRMWREGYGIQFDPQPKQRQFYFYYGPTLKEIYEQRVSTVPPLPLLTYKHTGLLTPSELPKDATRLRNLSVADLIDVSNSGGIFAAAEAGAWGALARWMPLVYRTARLPSEPALAAWRTKLAPYLVTYYWEARDRGFPVARSLAMQFPRDNVAASKEEVFMLGDELLISPVESFYLPQGIWTDFATNQRYQGRRATTVSGTPVALVRNGSILPIGGDPMQLHYFPSLAAEFFLYEPDLDMYSQFHASPALDFIRLQIESLVDRQYEWIVHHIDPPKQPPKERWHYDAARRNLHVWTRGRAGDDVIINVK